MVSPTLATYFRRHSTGLEFESESQDERCDRFTDASRIPTPPPDDEGLDAELAGATATLSITHYDSCLRDLIVTQNCPVLFVGESWNRALPLAIGILRGSLEGIWATCYHPGAYCTRCDWHDGNVIDRDYVIKETEWRITLNDRDRGKLQGEEDIVLPMEKEIRAKLGEFGAYLRGISESNPLRELCGHLDATKLQQSQIPMKIRQHTPGMRRFIIWFQCPWKAWTFGPVQECDTSELLSKIINSVSDSMKGDEIILVLGLLSGESRYGKNFEYKYRLGDLKAAAKVKGFKHFEDRNFIRECILYGYRHHRCGDERDDDHEVYLSQYVSHVFIKE